MMFRNRIGGYPQSQSDLEYFYSRHLHDFGRGRQRNELTRILRNGNYTLAHFLAISRDYFFLMAIGRCLEEMGHYRDALVVFQSTTSNNNAQHVNVQSAIGRCLQEMEQHNALVNQGPRPPFPIPSMQFMNLGSRPSPTSNPKLLPGEVFVPDDLPDPINERWCDNDYDWQGTT